MFGEMFVEVLKVWYDLVNSPGMQCSRLEWRKWNCFRAKEQGCGDIHEHAAMISQDANVELFIPASFHRRNQLRVQEDVINAFGATDVSVEGMGVHFVSVVMDIHQATIGTQFSEASRVIAEGFIEVTSNANEFAVLLTIFYELQQVLAVVFTDFVRLGAGLLFEE